MVANTRPHSGALPRLCHVCTRNTLQLLRAEQAYTMYLDQYMNCQVNQQHLDTCVTATQFTVTLHKTISYIRSSYSILENITCTVIQYLHSLSCSWHKVRTQTKGFLADRSFKYYWYCMPREREGESRGCGFLVCTVYRYRSGKRRPQPQRHTHTSESLGKSSAPNPSSSSAMTLTEKHFRS